MSSFTDPLILEMLPKRKFKLAKAFRYRVGSMESTDIITVPIGFETDLASTPRFLWWLIPPHGIYGKAAVLHDYCYVNKVKTKRYADDVFLEAMEVLGVGVIKRNLMYFFVRIFGNGNY